MRHFDEVTVSYNFEVDNRLESVTTKYTNDTKTISFGYDDAGRMDAMSYPNGINSTFGCDAESRVTNIVHGTFVDRKIIRNPLGFKTNELINAGMKPLPQKTQRSTKTYNDADQLTQERVQTAVTNWTIIDYEYNNNGGLETVLPANEASISYTYDYDKRLKTVGSMTSSTEYLYDASGARIGRIAGVPPAAVTNYFVIDYTDGLKRPFAETDAQGNITRYYVWNGAQLLCHIEADGTVRYYHADELGSTLALTDEVGAVTDEFAYMPYGYATHTGSADTPFQWLGGYGVYYDEDTDLHLTLHRAYSSKLKRFVSPDPLGIDGGVNLYAYGDLNPLYFIDPTGEFAWVGAIGGAVGGFASDIFLQAGMNMIAGKEWNEDLDYKSAWISAGVGSVAGATGMGAITQGKKAHKSFKVFNHARRNVKARKIAMAAGKFRNPTKTAMQIAQRNMALKQTAQSLAFGSSGPILKRSLKELAPSNLPESTQPTSRFINTYQPKIGK